MRIRTAIPDDIPAMMTLEAHEVTAAHWRGDDYLRIFAIDAPVRVALVMEETAAESGTADPPGRSPAITAAEGPPASNTKPELCAFIVALCAGLEWEIENIAVAGPARRRGLGTRLLGEFLDRARTAGAQSVFLEVRESNRAARALYEKWAFVEGGRRTAYYLDPQEDAIVYKFSFSEASNPASKSPKD